MILDIMISTLYNQHPYLQALTGWSWRSRGRLLLCRLHLRHPPIRARRPRACLAAFLEWSRLSGEIVRLSRLSGEIVRLNWDIKQMTSHTSCFFKVHHRSSECGKLVWDGARSVSWNAGFKFLLWQQKWTCWTCLTTEVDLLDLFDNRSGLVWQ